MTEAQDATDRKVKRMRYTARALAFFWALSCTVLMVSFLVYSFAWAVQHYVGYGVYSAVIGCIMLPLPSLILWGTVALAWRLERIGGVFLVLEGFLVLTSAAYISLTNLRQEIRPALLVIVVGALPALAAGGLFLASWWRSRTPEPAEATE